MGSNKSVLEEHARDRHGGDDGSVLPVTFREIEIKKDFVQAIGIFWESWKVVNRIDLSDEDEYKINGKMEKMPRAEALLYHYLTTGHRVHLAFNGEAVCGIMVWLPVFDGLAAVRMLYFEESYRDKGLGVGLVLSIPEIRTVLFQTQKNIRPDLFLKQVEGRIRMVHEEGSLITWEMKMGE